MAQPLHQDAAISHSLRHEQALGNHAPALERLLLLQRPLDVCWVLQGPPQLLLRVRLLRLLDQAIEQGCGWLLQQDSGQCLQELHSFSLLRPVLRVPVWRAEEGHGVPS